MSRANRERSPRIRSHHVQLVLERVDRARPVLIFSEHMDAADGDRMFRHACALGLEGIVSKRLDKPYSSGRCHHWRKVKNPSYERRQP